MFIIIIIISYHQIYTTFNAKLQAGPFLLVSYLRVRGYVYLCRGEERRDCEKVDSIKLGSSRDGCIRASLTWGLLMLARHVISSGGIFAKYSIYLLSVFCSLAVSRGDFQVRSGVYAVQRVMKRIQ